MAGTTLSYGRWPTSFGTVETVGTTNFDYLHEDWLGNSRIVSNISNNTVVADQAYTPYGEIYNIFGANNAEYQVFADTIADFAPSTTTPIMWDTDNRELSYVGRWLSPDPAALGSFDPSNSQDWNRYAYVLSNPLSNIDPLGLFCVWDNDGNGNDGGYDSPDDPDTGDPDKCAGQGGHWFDGSPSDYGLTDDWSSQQNAIAANWLGQQPVDTLYTEATAQMDGDATTGVPGAAPVGEIRALNPVDCAATFTWSLAKQANIQGNTVPGKVGQAFLGNTFSGWVDLYHAFTSAKGTVAAFGSLAVNGLRQGMPGGGPLSQGITGVVQDKTLKFAFQNVGARRLGQATVNTAASSIGDVKIGVDAVAFLYALRQCTE
jgi:hypothetical protein